MKKFLGIGMAFLSISTPALSQSNVTLSGMVDLGVGRNIGNAPWAVQESTVGNSRLTFRGTEDLGGGLGAFFGMEMRYQPDTGTPNPRFFNGFSVVGLKTPYGTVKLGRDYTPAYWYTQAIEPWIGQTVAQLRDTGTRPGATNQGVPGAPNGVAAPSKVRVSDAIFYEANFNSFTFAVATGDRDQESGSTAGPHREYSAALAYSAGPLYLAVGYENPQFDNDRQWNIASRYKVGNATIFANIANGRTADNSKASGRLLALNYTLGPGEIKMGYATSQIGGGPGAFKREKIGLGYWHYLSKRTNIYVDMGHEAKIISGRKTGFDLGLAVRF